MGGRAAQTATDGSRCASHKRTARKLVDQDAAWFISPMMLFISSFRQQIARGRFPWIAIQYQ